jgi:radical SAM superfamily enzyme YgiQ (UPF0313 family)
MNIVLVNPEYRGLRPERRQESLGLGYLAAVARRAGHNAEIVDIWLHGEASLRQVVKRRRVDLVGVSILSQGRLRPAMALVSRLRRDGYTGFIVIGGHPPTFLHREVSRDFAGFDAIAIGEAEDTFVDLLAALSARRDWTGLPGLVPARPDPASETPAAPAVSAAGRQPRPLIADLDSLPFPARDTLPAFLARGRGPRTASVLRSRGCYGSCSFCDTRAFYALSPGPAWRVRSAVGVADEVEELVRDYRVEFIRFWDDNFIGPGERGLTEAEALAREFRRRRIRVEFGLECRVTDIEPSLFGLLKEAGLTEVFVGVEAVTQRQLDSLNKRVTVEDNLRALATLENLGLEATIGMITFAPDTTLEEFRVNLEFMNRRLGAWGALRTRVAEPWNRLAAYAGTPVEATLRAQGRLRGDYTSYEYDFSDRVLGRLYVWGRLARRLVPEWVRAALSRGRSRPARQTRRSTAE